MIDKDIKDLLKGSVYGGCCVCIITIGTLLFIWAFGGPRRTFKESLFIALCAFALYPACTLLQIGLVKFIVIPIRRKQTNK